MVEFYFSDIGRDITLEQESGPWFRIGKMGNGFFINCAPHNDDDADRVIAISKDEFRKLILVCAKLYSNESMK